MLLGGRRHFGDTCRAVTADQLLKSTPELMRLTAEFMDQLGSEDLATAATIADEFEVTVKALEQAGLPSKGPALADGGDKNR